MCDVVQPVGDDLRQESRTESHEETQSQRTHEAHSRKVYRVQTRDLSVEGANDNDKRVDGSDNLIRGLSDRPYHAKEGYKDGGKEDVEELHRGEMVSLRGSVGWRLENAYQSGLDAYTQIQAASTNSVEQNKP